MVILLCIYYYCIIIIINYIKFAGEEEKKSLMEDLGRLKDDFLLRKFQEADSTADLYTAASLDAVSSQTDLTGGAEVGNL